MPHDNINMPKREPTQCTKLLEQVTKKHRSKRGGDLEDISNADILNAVVELTKRFTTLEQNISKNTNAITAVCEQLKGMEFQVKKNEHVKEMSKSRRCNRGARMPNATVGDGTCACME